MRSLPVFAFAFVLAVSQVSWAQEALRFTVVPFGPVRVYRIAVEPSRVVILASGETGWNREAEGFAAKIASMDSLVIGVDAREYLGRLAAEDNCTYPSTDFENLSRFVQQKLGLSTYTQPILAGFSDGGALVYATLVQAPSSVFAGGVSIGFCPHAPMTRGVCQGLGLDWSKAPNGLLPAANPRSPWIVLPLPDDAGCFSSAVAFLKRTTQVTVMTGESVKRSEPIPWAEQLARALEALSRPTREGPSVEADAIKDLPVVEITPKGSPTAGGNDLMAVMLSGDGGWAGLDHDVGEAIAAHGIPMVGFSSLKYFWTPRTPEKAARDLARLIGHYLRTWHKDRLLLIGYSFGADVLPFLVNRLPANIQARTDLVVLLGPGMSAEFEFHLSNWFEGISKDARPTLPEVKQMKPGKLACVFGEDETDSLCRHLDPKLTRVIELPGGHHFNGDYPTLARKILSLAGLEPGLP